MSTETKEAPMLDDELAKIAWRAYIAHDDDEPDLAVDPMLDVARAVRAALAREHDAEWDALNREIADLAAIVHGRHGGAPLRRGETVTVSTTPHEGGMFLRTAADGRPEVWFTDSYGQPLYTRHPDPAGVAALEGACRRWQTAQEGD